MLWIPLALGAHALWGLACIGDKFIVGNRIKNIFVYFVLTDIIGLFSLALLPFIDFAWPEWAVMRWVILAGVGYTLGIICYFKALEIEEVSRINIWWNLIPLFTLGLAWVTIGEKLNSGQLLALTLLLGGAILASLHFGGRQVVFSRALFWMVLACLESAGYVVMVRYITQYVSFSSLFVLISVIKLLVSLVFFAWRPFRRDFTATVKSMSAPLFGMVAAATFIDYAGILLNQWALSLGPAALVLSLEGFQALFVFAVSALISRYRPEALREETDRRNLLLKLAATACVAAGGIVLAFA